LPQASQGWEIRPALNSRQGIARVAGQEERDALWVCQRCTAQEDPLQKLEEADRNRGVFGFPACGSPGEERWRVVPEREAFDDLDRACGVTFEQLEVSEVRD